MFIDELIEKIKKLNNPSVIGLDPKLDYIPLSVRNKAVKEYGIGFKSAAEAVLVFNKRIIDAIYDIVPAIKPQLAYYELYGTEGMRAFEETCRYAHEKGMLVIADGKRNDIGSTAEAYSNAFLGTTKLDETVEERAFEADALTVNPYLGIDGIKPFIEDCRKYGKGIFVLVKTSNKSSGQFQDILTYHDKSIYEVVAEHVDEWGKHLVGKYGYSCVGAVVGATYPNQAKILRKIMKHAYILVPGYGAQGGTARDASHCFDGSGLGAIVNASRSIMCAYGSEAWKDKYGEEAFDAAARMEAIRMRDDLNQEINR